ncbi:MAG: hypothetical protein ACUZ8A_06230 [Candidatus Bathyanammoxibius sp.]
MLPGTRIMAMRPDTRALDMNVEGNPGLKAIVDIVAYKISKTQEGQSTEENFQKAETAVKEYISDHFKDPEDFWERIEKASGDTKELQDTAEGIYRYYYRRKDLTFDMVRDRIGRDVDIALRTITDLIAYSIYHSPDDKGPEVNLITAETFVAEYVSGNFSSMEGFDRRLKELGHDVTALRSFSDAIYKHFCDNKPR